MTDPYFSPNADGVKDSLNFKVIAETGEPYLVAIKRNGATIKGWTGLTVEQNLSWNGNFMFTDNLQADGSYRITGNKIFISAGEHDITDNIIHLVLARLPDAPPGIKGVSLFIVPKFRVNADGSIGERNGIYCGGLEHKMGIHGNATAQIVLDNAYGTMVGQPNKGMQGMFVMMNAARLGVGNQSLGLTEVAYQNALAYAKDRIQMRSLSGPKAKDKPADPIIVHPDVRKMLLTAKALSLIHI